MHPDTGNEVMTMKRVRLLLSHTDPGVVAEATQAGIDGFVVDWERRGKHRRQAGQDTRINGDTLADLERARAATAARPPAGHHDDREALVRMVGRTPAVAR
jgi:hypothetical protein